MAFGKDPNQLNKVAPFGGGGSMVQRAKTAARRPQRGSGGGGGGGAFYWKGVFRPSENMETGDYIRFLPVTYTQQIAGDNDSILTEDLPDVAYREHHNGKRGIICSAGPLWGRKGKAEPCPSCDIFWEDAMERKAKRNRGDTTKGPNRMSCSDKYVWEIWDYGTYAEVYDVDKDTGQYRTNSKTGQPYTNLVKMSTNDPQAAHVIRWQHGNLVPWAMSKSFRETLLLQTELIAKSCLNCGNQGTIQCQMKVCGNPNCRQPIFDPRSTAFNKEQQDTITYYPYNCPHCQQTGYVDEQLVCAACPTPVRAALHDADLQVMQLKTGDKAYELKILQWAVQPPTSIPPEIWSGEKKIDLVTRFSATPPEQQVKIMGLAAGTPAPLPGGSPFGLQPQVRNFMPANPNPVLPQPGMAGPGFPALPYGPGTGQNNNGQ